MPRKLTKYTGLRYGSLASLVRPILRRKPGAGPQYIADRIYVKTGVRTTRQAVRYAVKKIMQAKEK